MIFGNSFLRISGVNAINRVSQVSDTSDNSLLCKLFGLFPVPELADYWRL